MKEGIDYIEVNGNKYPLRVKKSSPDRSFKYEVWLNDRWYETAVKYTKELEQDLKSIYALNFEEEISGIMMPELKKEIELLTR